MKKIKKAIDLAITEIHIILVSKMSGSDYHTACEEMEGVFDELIVTLTKKEDYRPAQTPSLRKISLY